MRSARLPSAIRCAPLLVAALACADGPAAPRPPDRSKAERVGYVIEVEGGVDGAKSVYIPAKPRREASGWAPAAPPADANRAGTAPAPVAAAAPLPAAGAPPAAPSFLNRVGAWLGGSREETPDVDHALNRMSRTEDELSRRRFDGKKSEVLDRRYDRGDAVSFDMWDRRSDSYGFRRNETVDMASRFDGERVDLPRVTYERMEFDDFERRSDKAEIKNWNERRAREVSDRFGDPSRRTSFRDRLAAGYSLMSRVSMQDINRYQYRRNRSDEKGALPVAKPGAEARPAGAR